MAKIERKTAKIFGETAIATGDSPEMGQFGSARAGTYNGTTNIETIQALPAWSQGWTGAVTPDTNFPPLPEMNGVHKVLSYQNAYLLQAGTPEYDSGTTYYTNDMCRVGNIVYYSLTDDNVGNDPATDTTNWAIYYQTSLVEDTRFDGQWVSSYKQLNTATAVGTYTIDLTDYLPDDNYNYEVYFRQYLRGNSSTYCTTALYNNFLPETFRTFEFNQVTNFVQTKYYILPFDTNRIVTLQINSQKAEAQHLDVFAYRRLGTNI